MSDVEPKEASALNRELTRLLVDAGRLMGFTVETEYPVAGGRIDVMWLWAPPQPIPGLVGSVPVVGFEIESSWRTRKHVKGDLLNLQDAGVALGVIVLAGADPRDDSLRRFATALVDRRGPQVLVWTEVDVRAVASGDSSPSALELAAAAAAAKSLMTEQAGLPVAFAEPAAGAAMDHTGTYRPLWAWLRSQEHQERRLSFGELERAADITLPDSCRHAAHWHSYQGSAVARAIIDAGWHASRVDPHARKVTLVPGPPPRRV